MPRNVAELEKLLATLDSLRIQLRERLNLYSTVHIARDLYVERRDYLVESEILVKCLPPWMIDTSSIDEAVSYIIRETRSDFRRSTIKGRRQFLENSLVD